MKRLLIIIGLMFYSAYALAAPPSTPVPRSWFGMTFHHLSTDEDLGAWLSIPIGTTRSLDSKWSTGSPNFYSYYVDWRSINTSNGVYDWTIFDAWLARNVANHVDTMYTVLNTPAWASSDPTTDSSYGLGAAAPPSNNSYYTAFVTALLTRAAGRIRIIEGWNEPDIGSSYGSSARWTGTAAQLVTLQQLLYQTVKAFDPTITVLSPAVSANEFYTYPYLSSMLAAGLGQWTDAIAVHLYDTHPEAVLTTIGQVKAAMTNYSVNQPIWNTEGSWGEISGTSDTIDKQMAHVSRYLLIQWSGGLAGTNWYAWDDRTVGTLYNEVTAGLGAVGPTNAALAYYLTYTWMLGATMTVGVTNVSGTLWTCTLTRPGGYSAQIAWDTAGNNSGYTPPTGTIQYRNLTGANATTAWSSGTVTVGIKPMIFENNATLGLPRGRL